MNGELVLQILAEKFNGVVRVARADLEAELRSVCEDEAAVVSLVNSLYPNNKTVI
jgi:hypothetical protein